MNINETNIIYLKYKFGYTGPKVKASLNSHKYSHTRQFEDIKCKKLEKMFVQYLTSGNWLLLITNLTFNLKIFEVFSHLHRNYKQDIYEEGDPILGKLTPLKRKILAEENLHTSKFNSTKCKFSVLKCFP